MTIRSFSSQQEDFTGRSCDNDAPSGLRQEFIDLAFHIFAQDRRYDESLLHKIITQSLGFAASGQPYGGFRYAAGRDIDKAEWPRIYDLICRLWAELDPNLRSDYCIGVNRILAGYHVVWDLGEDGKLHRVLPLAASAQIEVAFRELSQERFAAALATFREATKAYDDRPHRGRDACKNIFDALESVSKQILNMPTGTFGNVLVEARRQQLIANETISVLQKLYDMANNHFRHGMTNPFSLKSAEVDFVFVSCVGGILLFIRL
jgi:hypothetical protein